MKATPHALRDYGRGACHAGYPPAMDFLPTIRPRVTMRQSIAVSGAAVAAALMVASPVHADDQSYYNYLRSHGVPLIYPWSDEPRMIYEGNRVCEGLHNGISRDALLHTFDYDTFRRPPSWAPQVKVSDVVIDAAQNELCHDTLG